MLIVILILLQVVIFMTLISMFRRIMNKNVAPATAHLEELSQDYAQKEMEVNRQLEEVRQKSQEVIRQAQVEAEKLKAQILKEADAEKERAVSQARMKSEEIIQQADKTRQLLLAELDERISKEAIDKACELIQHTLPEQFKQEVHSHWVNELIKENINQLERLHIPRDAGEVRFASAFALKEEQRQALFKKLKSMMGEGVKLKEEVDPRLVAGVVITIGSLVLDGSLKNKIQEQAKSAK